jgi:hypothetical protein
MAFIFRAQYDAAFTTYATLIGKVAFQWNMLHENLGVLFGTLLPIRNKKVAFDIWNACRNDRATRDILRSTARHKLNCKPKQLEAIEWLLDKTNSLSDDRDSIIHSPYSFEPAPPGPLRTVPSQHFGNRLAKRLENSDLKDKLNVTHEKLLQLSNFAVGINEYFVRPGGAKRPWPQTPLLQLGAKERTRGHKSHGKANQQRTRQPQSSQE